MSEPLLRVEHLRKHFAITRGMLFTQAGLVKAVDDVSFTIDPGQTLGLVGESGCGKTTTAMHVLKLHTPTSGTIRVDGVDINKASAPEQKAYRRTVQAVFQDPFSSLSPRRRVRDIIAEPLVVNTAMSRIEIGERVEEVLAQVGLPADAALLFPHEFSGGQRQRVALARALAPNPRLIVLDEPLSALDVSIKAQVINLLKDLQDKLGVAYLLIAHDLGNVRHMSDRVGVMYLGKMVETAPAEELFTRPLHPYTQALLSSALPAHPDARRVEVALAGEIPSPINVPSGCPFHPRCPKALKTCATEVPNQKEVGTSHFVSCHLY